MCKPPKSQSKPNNSGEAIAHRDLEVLDLNSISAKSGRLESSGVCEDLIPTCNFLAAKCEEIRRFVPHPCMRTCNMC